MLFKCPIRKFTVLKMSIALMVLDLHAGGFAAMMILGKLILPGI